MISISYAITVKDELLEIQKLIPFLLEHKREQDEIVVVYDSNKGKLSVEEYLRAQNVEKTKFRWYPFYFEGNFSDLKNELTSHCTGDYIVNIDADEIPHVNLMKNLTDLLEANRGVDVIRVPRVNTVEGLTEQHIQKWGWRVNDRGWVNWPDYQMRIYKNNSFIQWKNKVHEVLHGYKVISNFPDQEEYALLHPKTIERQEKQNQYYSTL